MSSVMRGLIVWVAIGEQLTADSAARTWLSAASRYSRAAFQAAQGTLHAFRQEHVVGDRGDFFGVAPGPLEVGQVALQRAPLGVFVQRHLERDPVDGRQ